MMIFMRKNSSNFVETLSHFLRAVLKYSSFCDYKPLYAHPISSVTVIIYLDLKLEYT